jgi:hypothetical protein
MLPVQMGATTAMLLRSYDGRTRSSTRTSRSDLELDAISTLASKLAVV